MCVSEWMDVCMSRVVVHTRTVSPLSSSYGTEDGWTTIQNTSETVVVVVI